MKLLGNVAQGQTLPLVLLCGDGEYIVKVASLRNGMTRRELVCELFCTVIAAQLGFQVSTPTLIELPKQVVIEIEDAYSMGLLDLTCVGLKWVRYLQPLVVATERRQMSDSPSVKGAPAPSSLGACLLALDLVIANGDRTATNPNLAWNDGLPFIFDFEHCLELPGTKPAHMLEIHAELIPNLRESHIFSRFVSRESLQRHLCWCLEEIAAYCPTLHGISGLPQDFQSEWKRLLDYIEYISGRADVILKYADKPL